MPQLLAQRESDSPYYYYYFFFFFFFCFSRRRSCSALLWFSFVKAFVWRGGRSGAKQQRRKVSANAAAAAFGGREAAEGRSDAKERADESDAKERADESDAKERADESDAKQRADESDAKERADESDAGNRHCARVPRPEAGHAQAATHGGLRRLNSFCLKSKHSMQPGLQGELLQRAAAPFAWSDSSRDVRRLAKAMGECPRAPQAAEVRREF
ncbi:hypothetical protein CYMTET_40549 [Cymbomonas tetramitiformis]|uniref:Uncharacterized protein n=1 Tax=Cymbomonas tetramitiformis TaxID=36881 RepID=A0AAE0C8X0_9CHLO|nr:hypothetical protein CYMTET_40549 [Cymbomonas tetramitiformis]